MKPTTLPADAPPASDQDRTPAGVAPHAVQLAGVTASYGEFQALSQVSLTVAPGERVAVLGPSGAGKSTFLRIVNTSLGASAGSVRILGRDLATLAPAGLRRLRARIGTVYQQLHLVPQASVLENVLMGRLGRRSALGVALAALRVDDRAEVAAILAQVGLEALLDERVDRLSGGEQQRVAVARVLYQAPDIVAADEPFSSVDPERSQAVVSLLVEAARGRTLLLTTHHLEPVLPHFPRLVGLRAGRILFDRRREDVTREDLALLYQAEAATRSPEPRRVVVPSRAAGPAPTELRIGASTTPGEYILPPAVAAFARARPEVSLRLTVKDTSEVLRALRDGALDVAFVGARGPDADLHFEDFADDEIVLIASSAFGGLPEPLPPSLAAHLPRVDREPGSATRATVEGQLSEMGVALDPATSVLEAGCVASLVAAVAAGMGVGFASRRSVALALAAGRVREVPLDSIKVPRRFFVAWRRDARLPDPARAFLELARRAAGEALP
jgi:phosphonate transport system ATP-binding protein